MKALALIIILLGGVAATPMAQAQPPQAASAPDPLLQYSECPLEGGLAAIALDRAPSLPMTRTVNTAEGQKEVSVADGYRVMLAFPNTDPFVNLKIERSMSGRYASDKRAVLEGMQYLSASAKDPPMKLARSVIKGLEVAALNRTSLAGGVIGMYSFFDDKGGIIVTGYILNQVPERRAFQDFPSYRLRRDKFIENYLSCMAAISKR